MWTHSPLFCIWEDSVTSGDWVLFSDSLGFSHYSFLLALSVLKYILHELQSTKLIVLIWLHFIWGLNLSKTKSKVLEWNAEKLGHLAEKHKVTLRKGLDHWRGFIQFDEKTKIYGNSVSQPLVLTYFTLKSCTTTGFSDSAMTQGCFFHTFTTSNVQPV